MGTARELGWEATRRAAVVAAGAVGVVVAACGGAPVAGSGAGSDPAVAPLAAWTEEMSAEEDLSYEVTIAGFTQPRQLWTRTAWTRDVEVLAADDDRVTRVAVTYRHHERSSQLSGTNRLDERGPLDGKSFVVAASAGGVVVTAAGGGRVPRDLADLVRADHRWLGKPDPIDALVRGATLRPGEQIAIDEGVLAATVGDVAPDRFRGTAIVRRVDGPDDQPVTLELELSARRAENGWLDAASDLEGTLVIDLLHRRAVALTLTGKVRRVEKVPRRHGAIVGDGVGRARLRWSATLR